MISVAYGGPNIKIAGGNGSNPVWWIGINGTNGTTYLFKNAKYSLSTLK